MSKKGNRKPAQPVQKQVQEQRAAKQAEAHTQTEAPAAQAASTGSSKYENSYAGRMAKLSPSERVAYKIRNSVQRVQNVLDSVKRWGVTDESHPEQKPVIDDLLDGLGEAKDGLAAALKSIETLSSEFKPPKTGAKVYTSKPVEKGTVVKIGKRDRAAYEELMPGVDLDHLEVIAVSGNTLRVKLSDGTTGFCKRSQVNVVGEQGDDEQDDEEAAA